MDAPWVKLAVTSTLSVEGDIDWLNLGRVEGELELPVRPRRACILPLVVEA